MDMIKDNEIPVFLINGFLESGKTEFITATIGDEYFEIEEDTLLIVCEEGELEYDQRFLARRKTHMVVIDDQETMTKEYLAELASRYKAARVIIEFNGMWDPAKLELPEDWVLYQQITMFSGLTMESYLNNMKGLMGPMLRATELVIVNRCDPAAQTQLLEWKKKLRPMLNSEAAIVMEGPEGEIPLETLPEELPYDIYAPVIDIKPEDYGIWFFDTKDNPERYRGKTVQFTAQLMKSRQFSKDCFVPGRMAMTCCANDMQFIGFLAHYKSIGSYENQAFVKLTAKVDIKECREYGGEGPFLEVESMALTSAIKDPVTF